jgi:hypothetical protein
VKQQEVEKELEEKAKKEQRTAGEERGRRWRSRQQATGKRQGRSNRSSSTVLAVAAAAAAAVLVAIEATAATAAHCGNKYREPGVKRPGFCPFSRKKIR